MDRAKKAEGFKTDDKNCNDTRASTTPQPKPEDNGAMLATSTSFLTIATTALIIFYQISHQSLYLALGDNKASS